MKSSSSSSEEWKWDLCGHERRRDNSLLSWISSWIWDFRTIWPLREADQAPTLRAWHAGIGSNWREVDSDRNGVDSGSNGVSKLVDTETAASAAAGASGSIFRIEFSQEASTSSASDRKLKFRAPSGRRRSQSTATLENTTIVERFTISSH